MSQANAIPPHQSIMVTGSRTIPTKPYGNAKWEIVITRDLDDDEIIEQGVYELRQLITDQLDDQERAELDHVRDQG